VQPLALAALATDLSSIGAGGDPLIAQDVNSAAGRPSGKTRRFLPDRGCMDRLQKSDRFERSPMDRLTA
jgi:hypothetical protein